jgi:hypothetical protein
MHKGKLIARPKYITGSSSSSDDENNVSLAIDQEETHEARASTHDAASSSVVP